MTAKFFRAAPYADDAMNLPVRDIDEAIPFYESKLGFRIVSRSDSGCRHAVLARDNYRLFFVVAPDGLCYCVGEATN